MLNSNETKQTRQDKDRHQSVPAAQMQMHGGKITD